MSDQAPGLGLDLAASDAGDSSASNAANASAYVVLARKYRPKDFSTLIGQDALVRTLTNAFAKNRLAHAFLLTGVRGVGKTTSARILAKAFNCVGPQGDRTQPSPQPCGQCANCVAITDDRHVDVLEIDAASNNGVDYIRELQSELHYKPVQARYRVYIVDEVHMLSTSAFNAFLKTLEEPPAHVKFIFATTEANKLPITIRSRCQRFDLRRVSAEQLKEYYARLADMEGVSVDDEALALVAQAADGSVRDGLSMLDQAIALASQDADGRVTAQNVRDMLGLNDGGRLMQLFDLVHQGEIAQSLDLFAAMFADGADPGLLTRELAQLTHLVTRRKIVGEHVAALKSSAETAFLAKMANGLSLGALNRTWELLIKGLDEIRAATHPQMSFEMLLVRLCHVAKMPDPDQLLQQLQGNAATSPPGVVDAAPSAAGPGVVANADAGNGQAPEASSGIDRIAHHDQTEVTAHSTVSGRLSIEPSTELAEPAEPNEAAPSTPLAPARAYAANDLDSNFIHSGQDDTRGAIAMRPLAERAAIPSTFHELVALLENNRQGLLCAHMSQDVRPVSLEGTRLRIRLTERAPRDIARTLSSELQTLTGQQWDVGLSDEDGDAPLAEQRRLARAEEYQAVAQHPAVAKTLAAFPDATIHDIRQKQPESDAGAGVLAQP